MITAADLRVDAGALARYWRWDPDADEMAFEDLVRATAEGRGGKTAIADFLRANAPPSR
jgi:hypothetical protein